MKVSGVTGEKVPAHGVYKNRYGKKVTLNMGEEFPPCPKEGHSIEWEKAD